MAGCLITRMMCVIVALMAACVSADADTIRTFPTIDTLRQATVVEGSYVQTAGYWAAGDGGGAVYLIESASPNPPATGIALHNGLFARLHWSDTITPRMFGAKGDGQSDDTDAFNQMDIYVKERGKATHIHIPEGNYIVNPMRTDSKRYLVALHHDYSRLTASGTILVENGPDYTQGRKPGTEWYWAAAQIRASHCTVDGFRFSGNGTGTYRGAAEDIVNLRWEGVSALGPGPGGYHYGNKAVNCWIVQGGGQAMCWQNQENALIANNYFEDSSAAGFSRCNNSVLTGNISVRSHDAPYAVNGNCFNIVVSNNVSRGTTNGSGIDIVGAFNVVVSGNVIEDSAAWGILISYSGQQKCASDNVIVSNNVFVRNCRSPDTPYNGEICIGSPWQGSSGRINARNITVQGNRVVLDGVVGPQKGHFVRVTNGAENVQILNNVIGGKLNRASEILSVDLPTKNLVIKGNIWQGEETGDAAVALVNEINGDAVLVDNHRINAPSSASAQKKH